MKAVTAIRHPSRMKTRRRSAQPKRRAIDADGIVMSSGMDSVPPSSTSHDVVSFLPPPPSSQFRSVEEEEKNRLQTFKSSLRKAIQNHNPNSKDLGGVPSVIQLLSTEPAVSPNMDGDDLARQLKKLNIKQDSKQQSMIIQDLTTWRKKLEQDNLQLRDRLDLAEDTIRDLKAVKRAKQQEQQQKQQEVVSKRMTSWLKKHVKKLPNRKKDAFQNPAHPGEKTFKVPSSTSKTRVTLLEHHDRRGGLVMEIGKQAKPRLTSSSKKQRASRDCPDPQGHAPSSRNKRPSRLAEQLEALNSSDQMRTRKEVSVSKTIQVSSSDTLSSTTSSGASSSVDPPAV
ncbi:expressed unknown protein [Seminavis robusta]|uniref:Uncharacterized protein n=1 Tax=Seminavis robusta TaxID=568900 RepID=A0A9N8EGJ9_9STRA|nr:expressed unknown protein [Seminavis robusta]|eukprot:Sro1095_g240710.1 n/a (340) ;mRNA; f:26592-27611